MLQKFKELSPQELITLKWRRAIVISHDWAAIGICLGLSFLIRFDFQLPATHAPLLFKALPWVFLVQSAVFLMLGLYRGVWAFASLPDLFSIGRAVVIANLVCVAGIFLFPTEFVGWPRSIFFIDTALLILALGGGRFLYRYSRDYFFAYKNGKKTVLIIGAGKTGSLIAKELTHAEDSSMRVIGFIDDYERLIGSKLQGVPIYGPIQDLKIILERKKPDDVVIAVPGLSGEKIKAIFHETQMLRIGCRIVPDVRNMLSGKLRSNLRNVGVEDLLKRETVQIDEAGLSEFFRGKSVLITGAGGSIGSELSRQVCGYLPMQIVFFERSEFNLYRIERELRKKQELGLLPSVSLHFVLGDVLDENKLNSVFTLYRPQIVIHAAAYKHVPLIEENPAEGIRNNVLGTYRTANHAARSGAEVFVLVSTDKAVRPTSIMGATKRIAEMVVSQIGASTKLRTLAVRFGNVLDSDGSVLPLFRQQIAQGGPVTVTHPEMTRYFMTIPEASSLVLQATLLSRGGEVFILDMGKPVRIADLAEDLIMLSGLVPGKDIEIKFSGLRRGEKLYEELLVDTKNARNTTHPKVWMSQEDLEGSLPTDWEILVQE
ncbi:MAG: polysaccharide biosynthesis protein, partial [Proteobacteria bacterium]